MDYQRILIFRIGNLGDTLVSLPAVWGLRKAFPSAHITYLANSKGPGNDLPTAVDVLPEKGLADEFLGYPVGGPRLGKFLARIKLLLQIRKRRFDAVFYLMTRNRPLALIDRDIRFFRWAGIRNIIGVDHLKKNLIDPAQARPLEPIQSESEFFEECLTAEGVDLGPFDLRPDLLLTHREIDTADRWLDQNTPKDLGSRPLIAVAPGSKWSSKIWPETRYLELLQQLVAAHDAVPVIFGDMHDRAVGEMLVGAIRRGGNAAGSLSIREAAAALRRCSLFVGNDTGTMHLAASVGTPCVAIFSAVDWPNRWVPFGGGHRVLRRAVECEGCHSPLCFNNGKCLDLVEVEEVFRSCGEVLNERQGANFGGGVGR